MSTQKFPIDLKFQRASLPSSSDVPIDELLQILYDGIRNVAGDFYDTSSIPNPPFQAAAPGAVGNGSLQWTLRVREGMCRMDFALTFGATTFLGGGAVPVLFTYPVGFPPLAPFGSTGTALVFNAAAGGIFTGTVFVPNPIGAGFAIHLPQIPGILTPAVPAAFAAGDFIGFAIDYPLTS